MLYVILIIIAFFVYKIYKQKPKVVSKEEAMENIQAEIERREAALLNHLKTTHLKDYMDTQTVLFDCGKKNFLRLNERLKHDDVKRGEAIKDWIDYMEALNESIYESELLDVSTSEESEIHWKARDEAHVKLQEINKRFKDLLGADFIDPAELLAPKR